MIRQENSLDDKNDIKVEMGRDNPWEGFVRGNWNDGIDVRDFIQKYYTPYDGDESFLVDPTDDTRSIWNQVDQMIQDEISAKSISVDLNTFSGINNFQPGYIDRDKERIVGLQADGLESDPQLASKFNAYRKTHNQGVFDTYTAEMRLARTAGLLTGLPDAYGRGRIIGDYHRVALYGIDRLVKQKSVDLKNLKGNASEDLIRLREEVSEPATNAQEAIQWLYFAYLAAVKENNGAAMSIGRNTNFIDIYLERDLKAGLITEDDAQAMVDQLIIKLRMVRHLRTPEYDELFAGDPTWVTESIGGAGEDGRHMVVATSYRFLHSLTNLGPSPEPNMTVLWSEDLPENFKRYCAKMSIQTDALQYENDDLMRPIYGDDYAIACCVSAMKIGKQMQFFGARANLAKSLLYAINGGVDEKTRNKKTGEALEVISGLEPVTGDVLGYDEVHDKYAYEAGQMALHDTDVHRFLAMGIAGISIVADSLSAIKHAKVRAIRDENGLAKDFEIEGDFPTYGNDDDRVDGIAVEVTRYFMEQLKKHPAYRNSEHTLSLLTITSNVVYGKKTGSTPDGRKAGEAFAPGANPMHGRDKNGALASLNSVAKIPYEGVAQDGISNTFSITPDSLGKSEDEQKAFHLNVNVLHRDMLIDAMENPGKYLNLTIRVSGYAVRFNQLSRDHQKEVIKRTFHSCV